MYETSLVLEKVTLQMWKNPHGGGCCLAPWTPLALVYNKC